MQCLELVDICDIGLKFQLIKIKIWNLMLQMNLYFITQNED